MRDRSQRLHWIETLIGKDRQEARRNNALVIPTDDGDMAIAFSSISSAPADAALTGRARGGLSESFLTRSARPTKAVRD